MSLFYSADGRVRVGWRFLISVVVVLLANGIAIEVALALAGRHDRIVEAIYRPLTMILLLAGFRFLLITADHIEAEPRTAMGLAFDQFWLRDALLGMLIGGGMIALAVAAMLTASVALRFNLKLTWRTTELAALELFILATGAMAEELMFRGYPFQRLIEATGPARAVILLSVLFGAVHLQNPHSSRWAFVNTIAVGVLFAIAYLKTRALWLPWGIHFGWNTALGLIFGLPVSGLNDFSVVVRTTARGPVWLTGGAYGLEASALGTLIICLGLVVVSLLKLGREAESRIRSQAALSVTPAAHSPSTNSIQL